MKPPFREGAIPRRSEGGRYSFSTTTLTSWKSIKKSLNAWGYKVSISSSGKAALKILREDHIHVVLLDLTMPEMSGQEVWEEVRRKTPLLPIVILTGYSSDIIPQSMLTDPHTRFIQKPFELNILLNRIKSLLC